MAERSTGTKDLRELASSRHSRRHPRCSGSWCSLDQDALQLMMCSTKRRTTTASSARSASGARLEDVQDELDDRAGPEIDQGDVVVEPDPAEAGRRRLDAVEPGIGHRVVAQLPWDHAADSPCGAPEVRTDLEIAIARREPEAWAGAGVGPEFRPLRHPAMIVAVPAHGLVVVAAPLGVILRVLSG